MTLAELKEQIDQLIEMAEEHGESIDEIAVSIQIDDSGGGSIWSDCVGIDFDNNTDTSGCVVLGFIHLEMKEG